MYLVLAFDWILIVGQIVHKSISFHHKNCKHNSYIKYKQGTVMQSMCITIEVVSSNPVHGEMYSIQHYVIKFVSDLRQVGDFLRVLRFTPPIKLTATM